MKYQEWFNKYEVDLNKEFADKNGEMFLKFCEFKFKEESKI